MIFFNILAIYIGENANQEDYKRLFESIAGFGLGGSTVAMFGRIGGGIYTKAADVGSDLVGKVVAGLDEDSPKNPGVIADNVGDNVGDIAGMGSDLFGSLAESICAALVVSSSSAFLISSNVTILFPLTIVAVGIISSILTSIVAVSLLPITEKNVEKNLWMQLLISSAFMSIGLAFLCGYYLPESFTFNQGTFRSEITNWKIYACIMSGLWTGFIIGFFTDYYTSNSHAPVRDLAESCRTGAATNIISGIALGQESCIIPVIFIGITVYISFKLAAMYGIAMAALGMLGCLPIALTIDGFGPISDNAGGIAELAQLPERVRARTDILDAAGNPTAAVGKGFAIGSACLVAISLFGAFVERTGIKEVNVLTPLILMGLIWGAMLPYAFCSMTMKAVGEAAQEMIVEIKGQFDANPKIMEGTQKPDYEKCIAISTNASLKKMFPPGLLVILSPLVMGILFGPEAVSGLIVGTIISGIQVAISFSNTGGAWDNAKKFVEAQKNRSYKDPSFIFKKKTEEHTAAVIGDTVGDPMKDTSGPSINILIKLMAMTALVFGGFFNKTKFLA
jgi:H(+)-translocating pyrophosphatase